MLMAVLEPIFWCLDDNDGKWWNQKCAAPKPLRWYYSFLSMVAMVLYFSLLLDLAVFSTKASAYFLVCIRMISEVGLFLLGLVAVLMTFSSAISVIKHDLNDFAGIHKGFLTLLEATM